MPISKDYVRFHLQGYYFDGFPRTKLIGEVLKKSLGISNEELLALQRATQNYGFAIIECRPSQFARFIILREQAGFQNMVKELNAKLIPPTEDPKVFDFHTRENPTN